MATRKSSKTTTPDYSNPPKTLDDHIFFGLKLDEEQKKFRDMIWSDDYDIIFVDAAAGSGKTLIAVATSVLLVRYDLYKGIHYVVSANEEGRQGYLPGSLQEKTAPYLQGLWSAIETIDEWPENLIKGLNPEADKAGRAYITAGSSTYLRGSNIGGNSKKILIIDEAQNFTISDLRKTLTRACDGTKVIVIGHQLQCDLRSQYLSGFAPCMAHFKNKNNPRFGFCELHTCHRSLVAQTADEAWPVPEYETPF